MNTMAANLKLLLTLLLCSFGLVSRRVIAQLPQTPPPPIGNTIQVDVSSILIPVVVRDAHGHPVDSLKQEDFKVFDQGKLRPIKGFTFERNVAAPADAGLPQPGAANSSSNSSAAAPPAASQSSAIPNRFVVFLIDDRHLNPANLEQVQQAAVHMVDQPLAPTDRALVLSFLGANSGITRDPAVLKAAILKLKTREFYQRDTHDCPDLDYYTADQIVNQHSVLEHDIAYEKTITCSHSQDKTYIETTLSTAAVHAVAVGEQDTNESLTFIRDVVHSIGKLPGQRTLVLVSPGFLSLSQEAAHIQSQIVNIAASLNITINSIDARGLYTRIMNASQSGAGSPYGLQTGQTQTDYGDAMKAGEEAMSDLSNSTGGVFIHNTNNLEGGFKSLLAAPECVYLLELSLQDVKPTGTYHSLKVEVDQKDLKLQARKGYFSPLPAKKGK